MQTIPAIWDLIRRFKSQCRSMGWWVSPYDDIVCVGGEYHNFICTKRVYPKTFKIIALNNVYPLRENDIYYRLINVSYRAWVIQEKPPEDVYLILAENRDLREHTAIYDLSEATSDKPTCIKMNETKSVVFQEFERFLREECRINLVSKTMFTQSREI